MFKKLVGISLIAAMAVSFASCGDSAADDNSADSTANSSSSDTADNTAEEEAPAEEAEETEAEETEEGEEAEETEAKVDAAADAPDAAAGFTEYPIFEDEEVGFLNVSAVYFQPVPMTDGNTIDDYDIHLEADISALENTLGFGVGDWVPYLTVDYKITGSDDSVAAEGTFMEMSASDGPHYGANIALPDADTYKVEFTIHSPAENNYLLHTDAETGPGGSFDDYFADGNLKVEFEGWDYIPQEW